jgi:hypothetical protein
VGKPVRRLAAGAVAVTAGIGMLAVAFGRLSLGSPSNPSSNSPGSTDSSPRVEVMAQNLNNPRGLTVTPTGTVLVAEAGRGGNGACLPSPENPDGKVCLGDTGSVTAIGPTGQHRILTGLASIAARTGRNAIGPSDVTFAKPDKLLVSMGLVNESTRRKELGAFGARLGTVQQFHLSEGAQRVASEGARRLADLAEWESNRPNLDGRRRDSNPTSVVALDDGRVAVTDAGNNRLMVIGAQGGLKPLAAFPNQDVAAPSGSGSAPHRQSQQQAPAEQARQGQAQQGRGQMRPGQARPGRMQLESVPTSVTRGPDGALYVGELVGFPFPTGAARVWRMVPGEQPTVYAKGFTNIIDLAFDRKGRLYVLEIAKHGLQSPDKTGALIRVEADGKHTELLSKQLTAPGGMVFGPGEALYISNRATSAGTGEVLRIQF